MADHLKRAFFEEELPKLAAAYAAEVKAEKVTTDVMLRSGVSLRMEGTPVCADEYIQFDTKNGGHLHRAVLPYGAILGISFAGENASGVGFVR